MPQSLEAKYAKLARKIGRRSTSMPERCLIITVTKTKDARGGTSSAPVGIPTYNAKDLIPCRVEGRAGQEREVGGITQAVAIYTVRLMALMPDGVTPVGAIKEKDRLYVLPRGSVAGRMLEVESVALREGVSIDVVALLKGS